jgi:D-3-phosphoglycerate dehydrogenase
MLDADHGVMAHARRLSRAGSAARTGLRDRRAAKREPLSSPASACFDREVAVAASKYEILVLNQISPAGLKRFPGDKYRCAEGIAEPDAILVRSADLNSTPIAGSVRAIGRAGSGTNNIPVKGMSRRGVPVFNAPGANANAVKELVLAGMLMAARNLLPAVQFVGSLRCDDETLAHRVEAEKKRFAGTELRHRILGVVGLGRVGSLVADAAIKLGMNVVGYDPELTVEAAWSLPSQVKRAGSLQELLKASDCVTLHLPFLPGTRHLVDAQSLESMRPRSILLNFSREEVVDAAAVATALACGKLRCYVTDFPARALSESTGVIALPHLGASTCEAEDVSAVMVVDQVRDYLEHGNIRNAVNFPNVEMEREAPFRVGIANANFPNMMGQVSSAMARAGLNIHNMTNRSKGELAYTLVDLDSPVKGGLLEELCGIKGVLSVRYLPAA